MEHRTLSLAIVSSDIDPLSLCSPKPTYISLYGYSDHCMPAMSSNTRSFLSLRAWHRCEFGEGQGLGYICSQSLHGNHPQVWSFWNFKNPLSAGIVQPAGSLCCRIPAPSLLPGTLEGAQLLCPQIKAKLSTQLHRNQKMAFSVVLPKKLPSQGIWFCWILAEQLLPNKAADRRGQDARPRQAEMALCHSSGKQSCTKRVNFSEMPGDACATASVTNP